MGFRVRKFRVLGIGFRRFKVLGLAILGFRVQGKAIDLKALISSLLMSLDRSLAFTGLRISLGLGLRWGTRCCVAP